MKCSKYSTVHIREVLYDVVQYTGRVLSSYTEQKRAPTVPIHLNNKYILSSIDYA